MGTALPAEVLFQIARRLDLGSLLEFRIAVGWNRSVVWDIFANRVRATLGGYFDDVPGFAIIMEITGAIIGGSTVLSIIRMDNWVPHDLDIIITAEFYHLLDAFLTGKGYTMVNLPPFYVFAVYRYISPRGQVDVTVTRFSPLNVILNYHSTIIMNYLTFNHLHIVLPEATLLGVNILVGDANDARIVEVIEKYENRGYPLISDAEGNVMTVADFPAFTRRIRHGDVRGMVVMPVRWAH